LTPEQRDQERERNRAWCKAHPERRKATQQKYRLNNAERIAGRERKRDRALRRKTGVEYRLKSKYGLTRAEFQTMLGKQEGRCAICTTVLGSGHRTHIDHDHESGKLRGLLCASCNKGLGHFREKPALLLVASSYIAFHRAMA
jgi:hypothetical protein